MTLLEQLQAHKGGLIQMKSQLYWYDGRGWDGDPARICLILDAAVTSAPVSSSAFTASTSARISAYLLIDGQPQ